MCAQCGVAVSFWLIAPYIAAESVRDLFGEHRAETTVVGIVLAAVALLQMPLLGYTKNTDLAPGWARARPPARAPRLPVRGPGRRGTVRPRGHRRLDRSRSRRSRTVVSGYVSFEHRE